MLLKQLSKLDEEDFAVLRGPFESGRQSPKSLGGVLVLSIFLQGLLFLLTYFIVADRTVYPYKEMFFILHLGITVILILFSIVYSIPAIYMKQQKVQYFISILVSQNLFGLFFLVCSLFLIGSDLVIIRTDYSLLIITLLIIAFGILIFLATFIRFYILLRKGAYRIGSQKGKLRSRFETKSYLPAVIVGSTGMVIIIRYIVNTFQLADVEALGMTILCISIFYTMLFVLPEQLVILYCKTRFDSFNFDQEGNLKPFSSEVNEVNEI